MFTAREIGPSQETPMARSFRRTLLTLLLLPAALQAQDKPIVGLIPKVQKPIQSDGKLTGWDGAFVTPVHIGHPDFANRGAEFLYLWDEQNLYIGLRCLDQKPAHVGGDGQLWNGDAVVFADDDAKYLEFITPQLQPPPGGWPEGW
jgi:hypothetical protein